MNRRGEFELIAEVFRPLTLDDPSALGLADDAALFRCPPSGDLVVTTDAMADGVHFSRAAPPAEVGRKLLRVNLSDIAAMGGAPVAYTLVAALPRDLSDGWIEAFADGLGEDQAKFGVHLVGGDTVAAGALVLSLTLFGTVESGAALRREGATPGDAVYVSGTVGDAGLGLRALRGELPGLDSAAQEWLRGRLALPDPRVDLGRALLSLATAAVDVSDGLLADMGRICSASGVGAEIRLGDVPISAAARQAVAGDPSGEIARLASGEDYELLFTAPRRVADQVRRIARRLGLPLSPIGTVCEGSGVRLVDGTGAEIPTLDAGYAHF